MTICRHCGSPRRGDPCWWEIKHPPIAGSIGSDPPCLDDEYEEELRAVLRAKLYSVLVVVGVIVAIMLILILFWE